MLEKLKQPRLWFSTKVASVWALVAGGVFGAGLAWYIAMPEAPWLEFKDLQANYVLDSHQIELSGHYTVNRTCQPNGKLIWRVEALATDGQVAIYGPKGNAPHLANHDGVYAESVALAQEIQPDGWTARLLISCISNNKVETIVSPTATVNMRRSGTPLTN
jgi:hypothetical protein